LLIPTPKLRHSLVALEMLRISLFGPPNRRKQPERYAKVFCLTVIVAGTIRGAWNL
jgi:hypothetical protein